jgi:hypothetical protein
LLLRSSLIRSGDSDTPIGDLNAGPAAAFNPGKEKGKEMGVQKVSMSIQNEAVRKIPVDINLVITVAFRLFYPPSGVISYHTISRSCIHGNVGPSLEHSRLYSLPLWSNDAESVRFCHFESPSVDKKYPATIFMKYPLTILAGGQSRSPSQRIGG